MCEDDRRLDDYFEIFKDLIIRYAKSYVGDYYIAEDICQETLSDSASIRTRSESPVQNSG